MMIVKNAQLYIIKLNYTSYVLAKTSPYYQNYSKTAENLFCILEYVSYLFFQSRHTKLFCIVIVSFNNRYVL